MDEEKEPEEQEEDKGSEESSTEESTEEVPKEESPEEKGEKDSNSLAGRLNAKLVAVVAASLIVGVIIGQIALPGLGVGLIALPGDGLGTGPIDTAALQAKVEAYLNENVLGPQGVEGKVLSIESYDEDFYKIEIDILQDGESLGPQELFLTKSGNAISGTVIFLNDPVDQPALPELPGTGEGPEEPANVGNFGTFADSGYALELEDGKPVIYLFTTTWCPHCTWVKETFDSVVSEYVAEGKIVAHHWELDTGDDTLTDEIESEVPAEQKEAYAKFNPRGSIPTFVFGGRYYRVGNGYEQQDDLVAEAQEFRDLIDSLLEEAGQ